MNLRRSLALLLLLGLTSAVVAAVPADKKSSARVPWKKIVLDTKFRSEGVAAADVNKDGKVDVLAGDCWYENLGGGKWERRILRKDRAFDPANYSESFGCFADDFTGDGYPDLIVIPFPGAACNWYENPGKAGGLWKEHLLTTSACNETPIYIDLFKTGKKVLVMGWNPPKQENMGEMCYFTPGSDPRQPWTKVSISGPSTKEKVVPGTHRFSHGLGHGDINGDGRIDILVPQGWWEQPAKADPQAPWTFHPTDLGPNCADMYAADLDGDGKNDVISSSAHDRGFWWHQQRPGKDKDDPTFVRHDLFPTAEQLAKAPAGYQFTKEEQAIYAAINKVRDAAQRKSPLPASAELSRMARDHAERLARSGAKEANISGNISDGKILAVATVGDLPPAEAARALLEQADKANLLPGYEIGVGSAKMGNGDRYTLIVADRGRFALPAQTHALHYVDIDGDGLKDLVTGRRWWAHGAKGDRDPADPPDLYWFQAKKRGDGTITFTPHQIDDDSGIGTQFAIEDVDGDGVPDIVISNKRGVFVFLQVREPAAAPGKE